MVLVFFFVFFLCTKKHKHHKKKKQTKKTKKKKQKKSKPKKLEMYDRDEYGYGVVTDLIELVLNYLGYLVMDY